MFDKLTKETALNLKGLKNITAESMFLQNQHVSKLDRATWPQTATPLDK